jgi:redox-sensitive bicupin YhaK (pirin superfamily)
MADDCQGIFVAEKKGTKMSTIIHRANTRGKSNYDWLDSKHNFSFAGYVDRDRVHFGALRVLNDDIVQPGTGFGKHPHDNMEIISIPIKGALLHQDSMNHEQTIGENEVQVMSAGTGLYHAEYNASKTEAVNFLQLWIYPDRKNIKPVYDQKYFPPEEAINKWQYLVNEPESTNAESLRIHQNARISRVFLKEGNSISYQPDRTNYGCFLFIVYGRILHTDETFADRDAIGIVGNEQFTIKAGADAYIINVEVPELAAN